MVCGLRAASECMNDGDGMEMTVMEDYACVCITQQSSLSQWCMIVDFMSQSNTKTNNGTEDVIDGINRHLRLHRDDEQKRIETTGV